MRKRNVRLSLFILLLALAGSGIASMSVMQSHDPEETEVLRYSTNASTGSCGVERWSVKTGTDADKGLVNLNGSTSTTVAALRALAQPATLPANNRIQPTETTQYALSATLTEYKLESDSDYHLVIQDASGNTMIAEIPDPACVGTGSPFTGGIQVARAEFDNKYVATTSFKTANVPVCITGVGFFDFLHGQTGVAPNGIEIHPVLDIQFNPTSCSGSGGGGGGGTTVLTNGVPVTGVSGAAGSQTLFTLAVPSGASGLKFTTSGGTGDADLYVRFGSAPTTSTYDCRSVVSGSNAETCSIATAQAGTYYAMVYGYKAYSGLSITGSYSTSGGGGGGGSQLLGNPGFENGSSNTAPWTTSSGVVSNSTSEPPHGGSWDAWMDGYGSTHTDSVSQQVAIPSTVTSATLSYWLHVDTAETGSTAYDKLTVGLYSTSGTLLKTLATHSNVDAATGYVQHSVDVSAYKGQTVVVKFTGTEDSTLQTSFVLDDVNLNTQ